ncbi:phosphotransferase [Coralliovum pocilloporae]|uniref:phosphotransferase n=1 Tax=Coralliovum pocilloporae TaxID=3066369 RepID=UPI0033073BCA
MEGTYEAFRAQLAKEAWRVNPHGPTPGLSETLHGVECLSDDQAWAVCQHLCKSPESLAPLGGEARDVWRVSFAGRPSLVLMYRKVRQRAVLERNVLVHLRKAGLSVPKVHAAQGHWLVTEDLGDLRLPLVLSQKSRHQQQILIEKALQSLLTLQKLGHQIGLSEKVAPIGKSASWVSNLSNAPRKLARLAQVEPSPALDLDGIHQLLTCTERRFIKWDARLGNAMVGEGGTIRWFDFEHCGTRDPLDDLAWFFGDETLPNDLVQDDFIFEEILPAFCRHRPQAAGQRYLRVMATLHMCIRLSNILIKKDGRLWWDNQACLDNDSILVTESGFAALCQRAASWAGRDKLTAPLVEWLLDLPDHIQTEKTALVGPVTVQFT